MAACARSYHEPKVYCRAAGKQLIEFIASIKDGLSDDDLDELHKLCVMSNHLNDQWATINIVKFLNRRQHRTGHAFSLDKTFDKKRGQMFVARMEKR